MCLSEEPDLGRSKAPIIFLLYKLMFYRPKKQTPVTLSRLRNKFIVQPTFPAAIHVLKKIHKLSV